MSHARLRVRAWRGDGWCVVAGDFGHESHASATPDPAWLPIARDPPLLLDFLLDAHDPPHDVATLVVPVLQALVEASRASATMSAELASRYEEIDLLYFIGDLLGRAHGVDEVATIILREVCAVVGARRAGLRVYDEAQQVLRSVATLNVEPGAIPDEVSVDDQSVVVSRAFRSGRIETGTQVTWVPGEVVAVPIIHALQGQEPRVIGTLALADRAGGGQFTPEETKLIAAVATQIGAALQNARLAAGERERQRMEHELQLAHDLQMRLMPLPSVLRGDADVAVRSDSAESVGGDFYTFARLGRGRVGIMLGDVASHGLSAALIAAEVLAAAGIHANSTTPPDEMLTLLRDSLADELEQTEMYLTIFYGILDPTAGRLVYASAGHAHAFHVPASGPARRLDPTAPPLGLVEAGRFKRSMIPWQFGTDLLVLFTDGLQDHAAESGERFGEPRVIDRIERDRARTPQEITRSVFEDLAAFGGTSADDCTLLVLRM